MLGLNSELESSCLPEQLRYIIHLSHGGSRGAPFGEGTLSLLRRYLKPLPKGGRGGGGG